MSTAASAYTRTSQATSSPREIEAQTLLMAARKLQEVQNNWSGPDKKMNAALLFNRRLWTIFMSAAESDNNPYLLEMRRSTILNHRRCLVMQQTIDMQFNPDPAKLKPLIDINCNIAAGLSGRA